MTVLADGVFDPLHGGHLAYLDACAEQAGSRDQVVVQVSPQRKRPQLLSIQERAEILRRMGYQVVTYPSTLEALEVLRPAVYMKGVDWLNRGIPKPEQVLCDRLRIRVNYVQASRMDSSTRLLGAWAHQQARLGADELNADAVAQQVVPFDAEAQGYGDYGTRVALEARHPEILAQLCHGRTVLDYGCGPGYLVQMLRERGVQATGVDPYVAPRYPHCRLGRMADLDARASDVVVCREVLEHVPVREWGALLHHLFRVAKERVYLTTRFYLDPPHPFALTDERVVDPSHITVLPQPFVRALCTTFGGVRDRAWESALDWLHKDRVLVYQVPR